MESEDQAKIDARIDEQCNAIVAGLDQVLKALDAAEDVNLMFVNDWKSRVSKLRSEVEM